MVKSAFILYKIIYVLFLFLFETHKFYMVKINFVWYKTMSARCGVATEYALKYQICQL